MKRLAVILVLLAFSAVAFATTIRFVSTQFAPAAEREFIIRNVLAGFEKETGVKVEFINMSYTDILARIEAEEKTGKVTIDLICDLHGGLDQLASRGFLEDVKGLTFSGRTFAAALDKYSYMHGIKAYIPFVQATYVMVINKEAFKYLPEGLTKEDVINGTKKWTYYKLLAWAKNIMDECGLPLFGMPMSPRGLFHRFLHGYIYPSFTGAQAIYFDSIEAEFMWEYLKRLHRYIHPSSTVWHAMAEPLLRGEVLIAWDHTARIVEAIRNNPEQFVVVPVPRGPEGRGYILVAAGLAIPKNAPHRDLAIKLMEYLTRPDVQALIPQYTGFFPAVVEASKAIPEGPTKVLAAGVAKQASAPDSIVAMIPNLGPKSGEFTDTYREAYKRIVLYGEDIPKVIKELGAKIDKMFKETGAPLPLPDCLR